MPTQERKQTYSFEILLMFCISPHLAFEVGQGMNPAFLEDLLPQM
jgi:hypothetical protein